MLGTSQSDSRCFSDTWDLIPYADDEELDDSIDQGKVLSAEQLIERLKNIENIFDHVQSGRGYSPEAFALLCTLLTCVSWSKENRAIFTSLSTLIDQEKMLVDENACIVDETECTSLDTSDNGSIALDCEPVTQSGLINKIKLLYVNTYMSELFVKAIPRGPPVASWNYYLNDIVFDPLGYMFIDITEICCAGLAKEIKDTCKEHLQNRLYSNNLLNQANRRQFL